MIWASFLSFSSFQELYRNHYSPQCLETYRKPNKTILPAVGSTQIRVYSSSVLPSLLRSTTRLLTGGEEVFSHSWGLKDVVSRLGNWFQDSVSLRDVWWSRSLCLSPSPQWGLVSFINHPGRREGRGWWLSGKPITRTFSPVFVLSRSA